MHSYSSTCRRCHVGSAHPRIAKKNSVKEIDGWVRQLKRRYNYSVNLTEIQIIILNYFLWSFGHFFNRFCTAELRNSRSASDAIHFVKKIHSMNSSAVLIAYGLSWDYVSNLPQSQLTASSHRCSSVRILTSEIFEEHRIIASYRDTKLLSM